MDIKARVGQKIRELREQAGLSQEQLAQAARLDRAFMGQVERGEKGPGLESLEKLAMALKVDVRDIFDPMPRRNNAKPSPPERLARRVQALAQTAPHRELDRFEALAATFFATYRPKRAKRSR